MTGSSTAVSRERLERILVPLDGSELSARVLSHVARLIGGHDAEVILLRVLPPELASTRDDVRRDLEEAARELRERRARVRCEVLVGDAAERIEQLAIDSKVSLIAMSTHGRTGLARWVRGSIAERVLRRSAVPLLLSNPFGRRSEGAVGKILVPLDGSELSAEILPVVGALARAFGAEVLLHRVVELPRVEPLIHPLLVSTEDAQHELESLRPRLDGVKVTIVSEFGTPAATIVERAAAEKVDLVAMTTHGRSGVKRWAFGSVAEQVVRHCGCPLLVKRMGAATV